MKQNRHYREEYQIMSDIVYNIMNGQRKRTQIMYSSRLSYSQLDYYLSLMDKRQLIQEHKDDIGARFYIVTELGLELHTMISRVKEIIGQ